MHSTAIGKEKSTDETTLVALRSLHPLPGIVLEYRKLLKILSTYSSTFPGARVNFVILVNEMLMVSIDVQWVCCDFCPRAIAFMLCGSHLVILKNNSYNRIHIYQGLQVDEFHPSRQIFKTCLLPSAPFRYRVHRVSLTRQVVKSSTYVLIALG